MNCSISENFRILQVSFGVLWKIWLEQNRRMFENKSLDVEKVADSIVWVVSKWACRGKVFVDVPVEGLFRSWKSFFT